MRKPKSRVVEGYLYVYPYLGDDVFVYSRKVNVESLEELSRIREEVLEGEGIDLLIMLSRFKGRKVRVVVESRRISVEVLE